MENCLETYGTFIIGGKRRKVYFCSANDCGFHYSGYYYIRNSKECDAIRRKNHLPLSCGVSALQRCGFNSDGNMVEKL